MFLLLLCASQASLPFKVAVSTPVRVTATPIKNPEDILAQELANTLYNMTASRGIKLYSAFALNHLTLLPKDKNHGLHATLFDSEPWLEIDKAMCLIKDMLKLYRQSKSDILIPFMVDQQYGKLQTLDTNRRASGMCSMNDMLQRHKGDSFLGQIAEAMLINLNGEYNCMHRPFLHVALHPGSEQQLISDNAPQVLLSLSGLHFEFHTEFYSMKVIYQMQKDKLTRSHLSIETLNPCRNPLNGNIFTSIQSVVENEKMRMDQLQIVESQLALEASEGMAENILGLGQEKRELEAIGYSTKHPPFNESMARIGDAIPSPEDRADRFDFVRIIRNIIAFYEKELSKFPTALVDIQRSKLPFLPESIARTELEQLYKNDLAEYVDILKSTPTTPETKKLLGKFVGLIIPTLKMPLQSYTSPIEYSLAERKTPAEMRAFTFLFLQTHYMLLLTELTTKNEVSDVTNALFKIIEHKLSLVAKDALMKASAFAPPVAA